ncbi:hypothetical protein SLE2022_156300 [Rubroshorea leprosula]
MSPSSRQPCLRSLLLLLLLLCSTDAALCGTIVKSLPGFDGKLPFKLGTGYVTVGYSELFYYFIESEGNPKEDPVLLWYGVVLVVLLSMVFFMKLILTKMITAYEGDTPPLNYYPYSWTKTASILFVDAPVRTGFSYATSTNAYPSSDTKSAAQTYEFLKQWLAEHPQFLKVQPFIGADSFSGISAPIVIQHILDGNDNGTSLNLKGYILGCPRTDVQINENAKIVFAHRLGLVSDELYRAAQETCGGNYYDVTSSDAACYENLKLIKKCVKDINKNDIPEPKCSWASPEPLGDSARRSLEEDTNDFILSPPRIPDFWCHNFNYALSYLWANDKHVQAALNVREGTVKDWKRCNKSLDYTIDVTSVIDYHRNLSKSGLKALIYNGDHDFTIPSIGTTQWIKKLNLTMVDDWRPWLLDGQIAGYTIKYSENGYGLTYASVKRAGHRPQEYKRRQCYDMFDRFIHWYPL